VQLKDILKEKCQRRGKVNTRVLLLHDNAPDAGLGFQCLDHPPYSPDLAPLDYHLVPGLKKQLTDPHFSSDVRSLLQQRHGWTDNLLAFF
jgi:hypothetical protein